MTKRKAVFDAVRRMLGRGFQPAEVTALDSALDSMIMPDAPSAPESSKVPAQTSASGIALIHRFEGFARDVGGGLVQAYPDPGTGGKPYTIGWGTTTDENGAPIAKATTWTHDRANRRFVQHLGQFEREVVRALGSAIAGTSQAQFDALVSFHYNTGAIARATLTRKHKAGDFAGAAAEFARWNHAGGRAMAGLTRRRAAEAALYREGSR